MTRTTTSRAGLVPVLALALLTLALPLGAQDAGKSGLLRGPVVSFDASGPTVDVVVGADVSVARLRLKTKKTDVGFERVAGSRLRAKLGQVPHEALPYRIVDESTEACLASGSLAVLPASDAAKLTFCALGDSGFPGDNHGEAVPEQLSIARLLEEQSPDLVIHTGDIIYLAGQPESFDALFFQPYAATLARVPMFCTLGNHDVITKKAAPTLEEFPFPPNENGNRYYSFDAASVHFTCLDSNLAVKMKTPSDFAATAQGKWLAADLAATRAKWKVVFFHHPLYAGTNVRMYEQKAMRAALERLLDEAGVDLIVCGHEHVYLRTVRARREKQDDDGMVHVVTGGGGAPLATAEPDELTACYASRFHLTRFDVNGAEMRIRALAPGASGKTECFDDVTVPARAVR
jgi:predicted phosphodiesterase